MAFTSSIFEQEELVFADRKESIVRGGFHLFDKLPQAFEGISQIGVIGWGSQGPAQAQNLKDSLEGTAINVAVGLREGSSSFEAAKKAGFSEEDGSLGEMFSVIKSSDLVILLISDAAQTKLYKEVFAALKPGATLGLSHGFLLGYLDSLGEVFPKDINVIAVCPKGMGASVRRLYEQGKEVNGAGINCSFAIHQDVNGKATDIALGWAVALGAPFSFETTLRDEYKSDIFGERGILLGGVHGLCEAAYKWFIAQGESKEAAFLKTAEVVTGPITEIMSKKGLKAVYESFEGEDKEIFEKAYSFAYEPCFDVLLEIYEDVASGNEIRGVVFADDRYKRFSISKIENMPMWQVGAAIENKPESISLNPVVAGIHMACMVAQIDLLIEKGHCYSEIANESVIEAVDSLYPYMAFRGAAYMIDNCSMTAKLGARKWAPRFDYALCQETFPKLDANFEADADKIEAFKGHVIHKIMETCLSLRPSVDIFVKEIA